MRALSIAALTIALSHPVAAFADGEPPAKTISGPEAEQFITFFLQFADAVTANRADCGALATAVNGVIDKNLPVLQASWAAKKAGQQLPRDVQKVMDKRATELVAGLRRCASDSAVKAAFARMKAPPEPAKK